MLDFEKRLRKLAQDCRLDVSAAEKDQALTAADREVIRRGCEHRFCQALADAWALTHSACPFSLAADLKKAGLIDFVHVDFTRKKAAA